MASRQGPWNGREPAPIDIQPGNLGDLREIMRIMETAFPKTYGEGWNHHQCRSMLSMPSAKLLIARTYNTVCGFVISRQAADEEELLMIAVSPDHQRQGVGHCLLEHMLLTARSDDVSSVFLEMRANNPAAKLYAEFGFHQIGLRKDYYTGPNKEKFDAITYKATFAD
ncbi:ribosomal protein S18-alanine N-acetyltransferase [Parasphingorhabdus flavimaris]